MSGFWWIPIGFSIYFLGVFLMGLFCAELFDPENSMWKDNILVCMWTWPISIWIVLSYQIALKRLSRAYMKVIDKKRKKRINRIGKQYTLR